MTEVILVAGLPLDLGYVQCPLNSMRILGDLRVEAWVCCPSSLHGTWREFAPSGMKMPSRPDARRYCMSLRLVQGNMYQKFYCPRHHSTQP